MRSGPLAVPALVALLSLSAGPAEAHAFGARYDLPAPLVLYLGGAGLAVAVSFVVALAFLRRGRTGVLEFDIPVPVGAAAALGTVLRIVGVALLGVLLAAAVLGEREATGNLATVTIWVLWWVGFLLFTALVINLWPRLDPFRAFYLGVARLLGRDAESGPVPLPAAAGYLAPVGLLVIAWVELVSDWSEDPQAVAVMMLVYLLVSLTAGLTFGAAWFRVADPLGRIFSMVGQMAPLAAMAPARLRLRPPGEGLLAAGKRPRGEPALVICLIGIVLFDGISETPAWAGVLDFISQSQTLRPGLLALRAEDVDLLKLIRSVGLVSTIAVFSLAYLGLVRTMRAIVGSRRRTAELAAHFAGSLLPIAVAYHLSHYVSYLMIAGQLAIPAASDPFALGWDLFGGAARSIDFSVIGARHVWWIAFPALIAGHSLSVLIAHRRALQVFGEARAAALSQIPMTIAMVGLTMLSLWILSQPIIA